MAFGETGRAGMRMISPQRGYQESGPVGDFKVAHGDGESGGAATQPAVVGKRVLGFAMQMGRSVRRLASNWASFFFGRRRQFHAVRSVNAAGDDIEFFLHGRADSYRGLKGGEGTVCRFYHDLGQFLPAFLRGKRCPQWRRGCRSAQCSMMASSSSWESSKNLLTATTTGRL